MFTDKRLVWAVQKHIKRAVRRISTSNPSEGYSENRNSTTVGLDKIRNIGILAHIDAGT